MNRSELTCVIERSRTLIDALETYRDALQLEHRSTWAISGYVEWHAARLRSTCQLIVWRHVHSNR